MFVHIHVDDRFPFELTIYASDMAHYVFKSSITGKAIERASIAELEQLLAREYPDVSLDQAVLEAESQVDRFQIYEMLLLAAGEREGESQVSSRGRRPVPQPAGVRPGPDELPYDEEFLLAALCCTTSARRSIRTTTWPPGWRPSPGTSRRGRPGSSSITWRPRTCSTAAWASVPGAGWKPRKTTRN